MVRRIIGIIVGYAIWSGLWLAGNAILFKEVGAVVQRGQPYMNAGPYFGILVLSVVCSLAAGLSTAAIAKKKQIHSVLIMAVLLLVTGIAVQAGVWPLMPVGYHLTFLALLVPVSLAGGNLVPGAA